MDPHAYEPIGRLPDTAEPSLSSAHPEADPRVVICIPVFNDWQATGQLIDRLDEVAASLPDPILVVLVDDGSTSRPSEIVAREPRALEGVCLLTLRRNVGHQRAIALGLAFICERIACREVLVMDGDGEDPPEAVPKLLRQSRQCSSPAIVFAKRGKRNEPYWFRMGYQAYRLVHYVLTGRTVDVGNFSVIPFPLLRRLMSVSELWNHYAAAVFHARLPVETVPVDRGQRLGGQSHMNLVSLVVHGLSAISVFGDTVGVRILVVLGLLMLLLTGGLGAVVYIRIFTAAAIPGWATTAAGILAVLLMNLFSLAMMFVLFVTQSRSHAQFLPVRDWQYFVDSDRWLYARCV
ncbi:MAG: glycosyltransferase [Pirellulales bacterium]|nr:glycosyltransferase [Pirellulales bacterium]